MWEQQTRSKSCSCLSFVFCLQQLPYTNMRLCPHSLEPAEERRLTLTQSPDPTGLYPSDSTSPHTSTWNSDTPRLSACPFYHFGESSAPAEPKTWLRVSSGLTEAQATLANSEFLKNRWGEHFREKVLVHENFLFNWFWIFGGRWGGVIIQDGANFIPWELLCTGSDVCCWLFCSSETHLEMLQGRGHTGNRTGLFWLSALQKGSIHWLDSL